MIESGDAISLRVFLFVSVSRTWIEIQRTEWNEISGPRSDSFIFPAQTLIRVVTTSISSHLQGSSTRPSLGLRHINANQQWGPTETRRLRV